MNRDRDERIARVLEGLKAPAASPYFADRVLASFEREQAGRRKRRTRRWRLAVVGLAAGALVVLGLVGLRGLPFAQRSGPEPASAAELMVAKLNYALSSARTMSGEVIYARTDYYGRTHIERGAFAATSAGDTRVEMSKLREGGRQRTRVQIYNEARHMAASYFTNEKGRGYGYLYRNVSWEYGSLDGDVLTHYMQGLAAVVRSALAEQDPSLTVRETRFEGRPAWRVTLRHYVSRAAWYRTDLVVDKESGFAVWFAIESLGKQDHQREEWRISDLRIDAPLSPRLFAAKLPTRVRAGGRPSDIGYHFGTLTEVAARVGFEAIVPQTLPAGFSLATAASFHGDLGTVAWVAPRAFGLVMPGGATPADNEIELEYRRGFERIVVEMALVAPEILGGVSPSEPGDYTWAEKMAAKRGWSSREVVLKQGYFAGCTAYSWFGSDGVNLVVCRNGRVASIQGAAARTEAVAMANSLQQQKP